MKKLLVLPFLLGFTSAVNAETWWLMAAGERILSGGGLSNSHVNWAIPTYSETECEIAGQKWKIQNSHLKKQGEVMLV